MTQPEKPYMLVVACRQTENERYASEAASARAAETYKQHQHWLMKHTIHDDGSHNLDCPEPHPPVEIQMWCLLACSGSGTAGSIKLAPCGVT